MKRVALAAIIMTLAAVPAPASAATLPPEEPIDVTVSTANGTGCKPDSYEITLLPGNDGFRVTYRDFRAWTGPGASPLDFRKNCQLGLRVRVPSGYTYAIAGMDFGGRSQIAPRAQGLFRTNFYYAGMSPTSYDTYPFSGGYADSWQFTDVIDIEFQRWVWCDLSAQLNTNLEARVTKGTSDPAVTSSVAVESAVYHFAWRRCPIS